MGADGSISVYDLEELQATHLELHGRPILEDWASAPVITLDGKDYIVNYWDTNGYESVNHAVNTTDWDEPHQEAVNRVLATLYATRCQASCTVWT